MDFPYEYQMKLVIESMTFNKKKETNEFYVIFKCKLFNTNQTYRFTTCAFYDSNKRCWTLRVNQFYWNQNIPSDLDTLENISSIHSELIKVLQPTWLIP